MAGMTGQRYNNGAVLPVKPPYGVCSSEADTQVKAVVVPSISALEAGLFILVKFSNAQTYDGVPKLNVNGLGAKDIKTNGTTGAARYEWNAGEVLSLYYDGTYWLIVRDGTASTTYYGKTKLTNAIDSDSETLAASAKAVKTVADQLSGKLSTSDKGAAGGVAELDATGKVPASQLPSYVDDVLEYSSSSGFPATGENGKIYIATDTNKQYRWSGTQYVEIASSLALGETSSTAYRGDRGKAAYDHATDTYKVSSAQTEALYKVSVTSEGHVGSVAPVQKSDITALGIPGSDTDTKNTAGTVNKAGEKMFLVGATTQGANPETNSNSKVYIGTDNELYSNEKKVAHAEDIKQMTGASASAAGTAGYVPAPAAGNQHKYLRADGTWNVPAGSKLIVVNLDTVTNTSGSYTHTTSVTGVTADMKPVMIEASDIGIFDDDIEITTSANAVTLSCSSVSGTSTVKVSLMVYGDASAGASAVTSAEFDILATRLENAKTPFTGATAQNAGTRGMVPAPSAGDEDKVLKGDGTWGTSGLDPEDIANNLTTTGSGKVLDARQGKVLNDKLVPFTGATAQANGAAGFVPAPTTTDKKKFLCGDGTWAESEGGKLVVFDLDTVTNSGGSYTHTTTLSGVTHDMKVVLIETDDPSVFGATVHVTTADGAITLTCDEVNGTADVTVSCMFVANADPITSSEFDVLSNRIGSLSALTTTDKSSLVGAVNELNASIKSGEIPCPAMEPNQSYTVAVSFDHNMPDANYAVNAIHSRGTNSTGGTKLLYIAVYDKSASGFKFRLYAEEGIAANTFSIEWTAIRYNS